MSGKKVTELNIANNLVDKIAELLDAEVHHSLLVDYKGNAEKNFKKFQSFIRISHHFMLILLPLII